MTTVHSITGESIHLVLSELVFHGPLVDLTGLST